MDNKLLSLFIALAEHKHFARAAAACNMSPPAASRAISRIEQEVDAVLVERDNRRVELTQEGLQFLNYARTTIANWSELKGQIDASASNPHGKLSLYCSVTASYSLLSSILPPLRQQYPDIELKVRTGDQADSVQRVLQGGEDLAIAAHPQSLSDRLIFRSLTHSPLVFIAPKLDCAVTSLLANETVFDWQLMPFVMPESGLTRDNVQTWFRQQQIKPNVYAEVRGHEAIVGMVALGFGVAVVPQLVLENSPLQGQVRKLDIKPSLHSLDVGVVCLKRRMSDPLIKAFWSVIS